MPDDIQHHEPGPEQLLGELEAAVMQIIWEREEATVRDVLEVLQSKRPIAYTTVMTIMGRLAQKGVLTLRKQGKAYYYRPTATPDEFVAQRAQRAVQDVIASFGDVAMAYFLHELETADDERLAALRDMLPKERTDAT
jgi:predicted transcriptional regulator